MATALTVVDAASAYERNIANTPVDPGFAAADVANGNEFRATGREFVLVRNTDGAAPHNVTVTSQPASRTGRLGSISAVSIAADAFVAFQIFPRDGWEAGGVILISADDAQIEFAVVRLPLQAAG